VFFPLRDINPIRHIHFAYVNYALIGFTVLIFLYQSVLQPRDFDFFAVSYGMIPLVVRDILPDPVSWMPIQLNFITYAFLHANWMHLLSNMLFLWIFGDNIEDALGHLGYLLFYLACAGLAGLAHFAMNFGDNGPLIGASGAVAGVMGAYVLLYPHARLFVIAQIVIPIPLPIPAFWMLGLWVLTQFFYAFGGSDEPVAWWAHLGGFAAGVGLILMFRRRDVPLFGGR
jgi:membrane associated rhomboid family serine protease